MDARRQGEFDRGPLEKETSRLAPSRGLSLGTGPQPVVASVYIYGIVHASSQVAYNARMSLRLREILRELRPHALWDGIKLCFLLFGGGGVAAAILAARDRWVHQHLDITVLVTAFAVSLAMLLVGMLLGGTRVADAKTDRATPSPQRDAGSSSEIVKLQVTTLDPRSTDPKTNYKAKLRVIFTNKSEQAIQVLEPTWTTGRWDVPVQHPFIAPYQTERSLGSWRRNEWNSQELPQAHINPGQSFRIYVGLSDSVPHDDLEARRNSRRLGTLTVPIRVGDQNHKWEERI
jgi:hypothetical protein